MLCFGALRRRAGLCSLRLFSAKTSLCALAEGAGLICAAVNPLYELADGEGGAGLLLQPLASPCTGNFHGYGMKTTAHTMQLPQPHPVMTHKTGMN